MNAFYGFYYKRYLFRWAIHLLDRWPVYKRKWVRRPWIWKNSRRKNTFSLLYSEHCCRDFNTSKFWVHSTWRVAVLTLGSKPGIGLHRGLPELLLSRQWFFHDAALLLYFSNNLKANIITLVHVDVVTA